MKANATRNTMLAPTFLSVNSTSGCKLSDLSVTGYNPPVYNEEDEYYEEGCSGSDFVLQFLNSNGSIAARYYWLDNGEVAPGWYASGSGAAIDGGAESVAIPAGTAAWVLSSGKTLQTAGAVNTSDVAFKMNASRNTAVGNCMPVDLKLSDLTVTGYNPPVYNEEDEYYEEGCSGSDFVLQFLNSNGSIAARYYWLDNGEVAPGWYASGSGAVIDGGAESVAIPAGKGAWVLSSGKTLNIPAPELDN